MKNFTAGVFWTASKPTGKERNTFLWDRAPVICKPEFANILQSLDNNITRHYKQCQGRDIWMLNSPRELLAGQSKQIPIQLGTRSCPSPSHLSIISFSWCQGVTFGFLLHLPPYTLDWLKILSAFSILVPSLPVLFIKPKHRVAHYCCKIISFLLAVTEAILPSEIHSKCKNHFFWITASSTLPLFHPASPPTGSPFFYYIKHKLLAFILRVVLRWWQLIQLPYTSTKNPSNEG